MVSDCFSRASHIDIETVEAEFADDMCRFIKVFRLAAEYLCHDGPFRGRVEKIAEDAVATTPEPFDIGKLSQHHVGASIETMHGAAWSVRYKCPQQLIFIISIIFYQKKSAWCAIPYTNS